MKKSWVVRMEGLLRMEFSGGGDNRDRERWRANSWWDRLVCDRARLGTKGASVDEAVEVDDRGWLVTVADRFGKYEDKGFGSTGESSGLVMGEPKLR